MYLRARIINRGLFSPTTLRHRRFDGQIVSMKQSGSHWLKYMLGLTLAKIHNLPPPAHIQDDAIIGHPKTPPRYGNIPQIVHSHTIPHYLNRSRRLVCLVHFPKYLILVRDMRDALVSHFEKWKDEYGVSFSTYLRGDMRGRYGNDIWLQIRFLNAWGAVAKRQPERTQVLKYEALCGDTKGELARVCAFFGIAGATPSILAEVVGQASKDEMAMRPNPEVRLSVVRVAERSTLYSPEDRRFIAETCRRNLRHSFGYSYG
jgi:hypothetical protein